MTDVSTLINEAKKVRLNAYAPYSKFTVGSCIETNHSKLYKGCNVENASYGLAVCAESNAIAAMIADGETEIKQIAVVVAGPGISACCGACRQRLYEFSTPETLIHLADLEGNLKTLTMAELYPHGFGPKDLA